MRICVALVAVLACRGDEKTAAKPPAPPTQPAAEGTVGQAPSKPASVCEQDSAFAISCSVPEASGAAWIEHAGKPALVVVGDSGCDGSYVVLDAETGATLEEGKLPLGDGAGQDIEGLATRDGKVYGLTSSGWMRVWKREASGFALVEGPYPLGKVTLAGKKITAAELAGDGMVCPGGSTNCGRNYEGLCLNPSASSPCVGFAASKADGHLYCITAGNQPHDLAVHHDRRIAIDRADTVADCAFSPEGTLWVGANFFGESKVYRVDGWADPASATVVAVEALGVGFPEVIAVRGDTIYRMSDTGGAPSLLARYRCKL